MFVAIESVVLNTQTGEVMKHEDNETCWVFLNTSGFEEIGQTIAAEMKELDPAMKTNIFGSIDEFLDYELNACENPQIKGHDFNLMKSLVELKAETLDLLKPKDYTPFGFTHQCIPSLDTNKSFAWAVMPIETLGRHAGISH